MTYFCFLQLRPLLADALQQRALLRLERLLRGAQARLFLPQPPSFLLVLARLFAELQLQLGDQLL